MDKITVGNTIRNVFHRKKATLPKQEIIAKRIGLKSRSQLWNILQSDEMDPKYVVRLGEVLGEDFFAMIRGLEKYRPISMLSEPEESYGNKKDLRDEFIEVQRKYIALLEEYKELQSEVRELQKRLL